MLACGLTSRESAGMALDPGDERSRTIAFMESVSAPPPNTAARCDGGEDGTGLDAGAAGGAMRGGAGGEGGPEPARRLAMSAWKAVIAA